MCATRLHSGRKRAQRNREHVALVGEVDSANERSTQNRLRNKAARQLRRLFRGHELFFDNYLDVRKIDIEGFYFAALHLVDESEKISAPCNPIFSSCCQCESFKFPPLSEMLILLRQLLSISDTDVRQFRKQLRAYDDVVSMVLVFRTVNWVNRAQDSSISMRR